MPCGKGTLTGPFRPRPVDVVPVVDGVPTLPTSPTSPMSPTDDGPWVVCGMNLLAAFEEAWQEELAAMNVAMTVPTASA